MKRKFAVVFKKNGEDVYFASLHEPGNIILYNETPEKCFFNDESNAEYWRIYLSERGYDSKVEVHEVNDLESPKTMWVSRDGDDNRLWLHPHSKPVLHTYTDYEGIEHKRWVTESQFEIGSNMYEEVTFENSPKPLIIGESSN